VVKLESKIIGIKLVYSLSVGVVEYEMLVKLILDAILLQSYFTFITVAREGFAVILNVFENV